MPKFVFVVTDRYDYLSCLRRFGIIVIPISLTIDKLFKDFVFLFFNFDTGATFSFFNARWPVCQDARRSGNEFVIGTFIIFASAEIIEGFTRSIFSGKPLCCIGNVVIANSVQRT